MSDLNVWNKHDFKMCGIGSKIKFLAKIRHIRNCIKWSVQRVTRGYSDADIWSMDSYLQELLPAMLLTLKENRHGSPACLGENYTNEDGVLVNNTCHKEWDKILDRMIFLWRESFQDTCQKKNPLEEEHTKAFSEFTEKYGLFGEKLQTEEERVSGKKRGGYVTMHFMREVPEYKELDEKYQAIEKELEAYRNRCKDEALDMLKQYFWNLWD